MHLGFTVGKHPCRSQDEAAGDECKVEVGESEGEGEGALIIWPVRSPPLGWTEVVGAARLISPRLTHEGCGLRRGRILMLHRLALLVDPTVVRTAFSYGRKRSLPWEG